MARIRPQLAQIGRLPSGRLTPAFGLLIVWLAAPAQEPGAPTPGQSTPSAEAPSPAAPDSTAQTEPTETSEAPGEPGPAGDGVEIPSEAHLARLETQIAFLDLIKEERFEEALPLAETMVELTEEEFGAPSAELATAVSNLAIIQRNVEQYDESNATFLNAIEMYREVEGPFTASTINPLVSLGANYHDTGQYLQALGVFQEARTVNRRAFGLLNTDQIDIVYHIAATLASMRRYEEAHRQHEDALRLMERVHGEASLEILPYIYRYADWLVGAFQFEAARQQYLRAMDIIRELEGPDSVSLVEPMAEIGNSFRAQKLAEGQGISSLKRALEVAETQPEPDNLLIARVLRDIGDWYTAFSRVDSGQAEYLRAWELLGTLDDGEVRRARWFDEPDYVLREYPSNRGLVEPDEPGAVEGYVRIVFDVDERGRTVNANVLESEPAGFKDDTMLRAIRRSRFRPRLVDGEVVYTTGLIRNFTFHYEPDE